MELCIWLKKSKKWKINTSKDWPPGRRYGTLESPIGAEAHDARAEARPAKQRVVLIGEINEQVLGLG